MAIHWVTAFLDLPASTVEPGARFWSEVTATRPSPQRGGATVETVIAHHRSLGATRRIEGVVWTTMTDPVGMPYCLTQRDPVTGLVGS